MSKEEYLALSEQAGISGLPDVEDIWRKVRGEIYDKCYWCLRVIEGSKVDEGLKFRDLLLVEGAVRGLVGASLAEFFICHCGYGDGKGPAGHNSEFEGDKLWFAWAQTHAEWKIWMWGRSAGCWEYPSRAEWEAYSKNAALREFGNVKGNNENSINGGKPDSDYPRRWRAWMREQERE